MKITIRDYQESDKELLQTLIEKLQDYAVGTDPIKRIRRLAEFGPVALNNTLKKYHQNKGQIYIAQDGVNVAGFIFGFVCDKQSPDNLLEIVPTQLGMISDLYIEDKYRGKGIGKMLLQKMELYLKSQGCDCIWLEVFADNTNAHNVYLKSGYMDREIGMLKKLV